MRFHLLHIPVSLSKGDDPRSLYRLIAQEAVEGEREGYAGFWVAEHHASRYGGAVPLSGVLLAHLAAITTQIRLGAAVAVLPLRSPLRTVEEFAMVDALSDGRLEIGVGRGFMRHEFDHLGVPFAERASRFATGIEAIADAFGTSATSAEPASSTPVSVQRPVPIWVAVSTSLDSCRLAGERGYGLMLNPYNREPDETDAAIEAYLDAARGAPPQFEPRVMVNQLFHLARTEQEAREGARDGIDNYLGAVHEQFLSSTELTELSASKFEDLYPDRLLVGNPETVTVKLEEWREKGVTDVALMTHPGNPWPSASEASRRMFATQVAPRFKTTTPGLSETLSQ